MSTPGRKMRRTRDVTSNHLLSSYDLYTLQGDASGALEVLELDSAATHYNQCILHHLKNRHSVGSDEFLEKLTKVEADTTASYKDWVSTKKVRRNELICAYNRALVHFEKGEIQKAVSICVDELGDLERPRDENVGSRMAFLLLECVLTRTAGRHAGINRSLLSLNVPISIEAIIGYLEKAVIVDPQLKFLLPVFKSRLAVAVVSDSKHVDSQIRSARKDLKNAMEVFQHKLRVEPANSTATADSSEETLLSQQQQQPPSSVVLQKLNQTALSLKAHLEQLKGNTKKSLILCSEAVSAVVGEQNSAIHSNNLGCLYETNNRRQLALYALSKSLRGLKAEFTPDGTAVPDYSVSVLHNVGVCALRACSHEAAYDCLAVCLGDPKFRERASTWLRLAEACIGIHQGLQSDQSKFSQVVDTKGCIHGVVISNSMFVDHTNVSLERLEPVIGSVEDCAQVRRNPLLRADSALAFVVDKADDLDADTLMSARLNYCFVCLCFRRYEKALGLAKQVLESEVSSEPSLLRLRQRSLATARMYAAEASCRLFDFPTSMSFLVGEGKDDAYEQLASQLSGVTFEMASASDTNKRRLAKAHEMVLSSAGAVAAAVGNLTYAKQLARRADSMDSTRSHARRALIYSLLREDNQWQALDMLLSLQ